MTEQAVKAEVDAAIAPEALPLVKFEMETVELTVSPSELIQAEKHAIRTSLRASTWDGVFATIFSNIAGGVLLSNFLVELHASPTQIGMLASIPMLANLLQPIGALLGDRTTSRHWYCFWVYGPSRLLWLLLAAGILISGWGKVDSSLLILWTLAIVLVSHFAGALGSAVWLSWLATLVPRRLRGRYFGMRNSAASLTNLVSVPLLGWFISSWKGGSIQGYGLVLILGALCGLISLGFQFWMVDVNPQVQRENLAEAHEEEELSLVIGHSSTDGTGQEARDTSEEEELSTVVGHSSFLENTGQRTKDKGKSQSPIPTSQATAGQMTDDEGQSKSKIQNPKSKIPAFLQDTNFLLFLLYFGIWMFAVNLSAPFFNLYMLDNLAIDLRWVTIYNSLQAGANLILLVLWGRLADRIGNRAILLSVGVLVALTPLLWLATGANSFSLWAGFPLLHILAGGTWAGIDLCNNNLQLGVAPVKNQSTYFGIAAAVAGVAGALGTTAGGFLVEFANYGGIPGLFALSAIVRLLALLPLIFVHEQRGQSLRQLMRTLFPDQNPATDALGPMQ
ncbi:MFS transporter [Leptodesmis sichuanensis]|uniref:MFS transporter n=1 Tax=Leptodesmis sichuanensis TaxID=2906798 RepID=UPI001F20020D